MVQSLTTGRILLRRWRESDRQPFSAMNADARVMEFMPRLLTPEETDRSIERINRHFERYDFGLFAAERRSDGAFLGYIGLSTPAFEAPFMPAVEIGWRLAAEYWGQGLATEGAREVLRFAFDDAGLAEVVSFTVPRNVRSIRVMEKIGMAHDAKDDFDHPLLPEDHALRRHVLYRLSRDTWAASRQ